MKKYPIDYSTLKLIQTINKNSAKGFDNKRNYTRDVIGGVSYDLDNKTFATVVCRATNSPNYTISEPTEAIINSGKVHNSKVQCGEGVISIK